MNYSDIFKALLFVGNLHEYLLDAFLGAILLHISSIKLLGCDGILFGLLTAAYRQIEYLLSKAFRSSALSSMMFTFFLNICLALSTVFGPSSNSMMQPSLDWLILAEPYNGTELLAMSP